MIKNGAAVAHWNHIDLLNLVGAVIENQIGKWTIGRDGTAAQTSSCLHSRYWQSVRNAIYLLAVAAHKAFMQFQ